MTFRHVLSLIGFGMATAGCSLELDASEGSELASQSEAIYHGLPINDPGNDDPQVLDAVVQVTYFGRWDGSGNQKSDAVPMGGTCSGVVLANDALVTSGHCIDRHVAPGVGNFNGLLPGESAWFWVDVKALQYNEYTWHSGWYLASLHPDFTSNTDGWAHEENDIVILVAQDTDKLEFIDQAEIWTDSIYTGMHLDMYGWGFNTDAGGGLGILRKGADNSELRVDAFDSRSLRGSSTVARTCAGDSGGPLLRWRRFGTQVFEPVIGILSGATADNQCTKKKDNRQMYTRLSPKLGWIQERLGRTCTRPPNTTGLVRCEPDALWD